MIESEHVPAERGSPPESLPGPESGGQERATNEVSPHAPSMAYPTEFIARPVPITLRAWLSKGIVNAGYSLQCGDPTRISLEQGGKIRWPHREHKCPGCPHDGGEWRTFLDANESSQKDKPRRPAPLLFMNSLLRHGQDRGILTQGLNNPNSLYARKD